MEVVATYGAPWAARMAGMSFFGRRFPVEHFPGGLVVVLASRGVAPERWIPVFMYASLSRQMYVKSWPRSKAPLMQSMPMSKVAPSPPMTTTFSFLPCLFRAASMPDPTAAWFSKREWIQGTFQAVSGYGVEKTSRQPVAFATMV